MSITLLLIFTLQITPCLSSQSIYTGLHYPFPGRGSVTQEITKSHTRNITVLQHTSSLHMSTTNSSTTHFPWQSPSDSWTAVCDCIPILLTELIYARTDPHYIGPAQAQRKHCSDIIAVFCARCLAMDLHITILWNLLNILPNMYSTHCH
jgi:hypothetical protein